jgi:hypothetical protein
MMTLCWAAKGGSGTTVLAASLALATDQQTLLIDLAGDLPAALGISEPASPGIADWLRSTAPASRLGGLEIAVNAKVQLVPLGEPDPETDTSERWQLLAEHLRHEQRRVIVDAGSGRQPAILHQVADERWLVTRACYLALRAAVKRRCTPSGIVLIEEPGRSLRADDVEASIGAPVVARVLLDPAVARAVDAGLLISRLPAGYQRQLRSAA